MPGSFSNSSRLDPYRASNSSRSGSVPVSAIACRLAAIPFPMPGISSNRAVSAAAAIRSTVVCSAASAARR